MLAPEGSMTLPWREPVPPICASRVWVPGPQSRATANRARTADRSRLRGWRWDGSMGDLEGRCGVRACGGRDELRPEPESMFGEDYSQSRPALSNAEQFLLRNSGSICCHS